MQGSRSTYGRPFCRSCPSCLSRPVLACHQAMCWFVLSCLHTSVSSASWPSRRHCRAASATTATATALQTVKRLLLPQPSPLSRCLCHCRQCHSLPQPLSMQQPWRAAGQGHTIAYDHLGSRPAGLSCLSAVTPQRRCHHCRRMTRRLTCAGVWRRCRRCPCPCVRARGRLRRQHGHRRRMQRAMPWTAPCLRPLHPRGHRPHQQRPHRHLRREHAAVASRLARKLLNLQLQRPYSAHDNDALCLMPYG